MAATSKELYKRGSDIWWCRFTDPKTGQQIRRSTGKTDKREAQEVLDRAKAEAWNIALGKAPERLWGEAALRWVEERDKRSIVTDAERLQVLNDELSEVKLSEIDSDFVRERVVKKVLKPRGIADSTINRYITLIQSILNISAGEWRWLAYAPKLAKPGANAENSRQAWLSLAQFKMLLDYLPEHHADMAMFALATGLRYGNVNDMEWSWVDIARNRIVVPKKKFKGKRDHVLPINGTAREVLIRQVGKHSTRVFTYKGEPIARINMRHWHNAVDKAGINAQLRGYQLLKEDEKFVFHGLRHTFATWLGRVGVPLDIIESLGGWSQGKNRVVSGYAHLADVNHLLPYSKKIDDILAGKIENISTILAHDQWTKLAQTELSS